MSLVRILSRSAAAAAAAILLAAIPALAAAQDSVAAVWVPKHIRFVYQGFTTHYSCDGLQNKIRQMLQSLGARDLKVRQYSCPRPVGPTIFPGVEVNMHVLVPASSAEAAKQANGSSQLQAHWKKVVLMPSNADFNEQGNCELIEQFKESFLPLFTTRHVDYSSSCIPHQITLGTHLSAEVLMPPAKEAKGD